MEEQFTRINGSKYLVNHVTTVRYAGQYITVFMAGK